jgi:hypothetical protein
MGTRADFYIGEGVEAVWLGSISSDGYPENISFDLLTAESETEFIQEINNHITPIKNFKNPKQGWPWKWENSNMTDYTYALINNKVMISVFGSSWIDALAYFQKKELINGLEEQRDNSSDEQFDISLKIDQLSSSLHTKTKVLMPNMKNTISQGIRH